jgi:hypothetical protein
VDKPTHSEVRYEPEQPGDNQDYGECIEHGALIFHAIIKLMLCRPGGRWHWPQKHRLSEM